MKKAFLAAAIAISAVALASSTQSNATSVAQVYQDTVPGKKDTSTLPSPDTSRVPPASFQLSK